MSICQISQEVALMQGKNVYILNTAHSSQKAIYSNLKWIYTWEAFGRQ